jgi:hypothetical protein
MKAEKCDGSRFSVSLTEAQRKVVAECAPEFSARMRLDERNQRSVEFTLDELRAVHKKAAAALRHPGSGTRRNSLRHVVDLTEKAIERSEGIGAIPASERVYQFRVSLLEIKPPIWRRIQVKDCTLDKLHEHIQTAMGWTNSHLHHFEMADRKLYGDPLLMHENFVEMGYADSTVTKISQILPRDGKRFRFGYEYDFGDSWGHEVLFEGCLRAEPGQKYPLCVEGARACPPEDVGGPWSYPEFLEALADPEHEEHEQYREWIGGRFDSESFDPATATRRMRRGLPDWRRMM